MDAIEKEERTWAMVAHLSAFAMYFTGIGHILGPLLVWLVKRDGHPFVDDQGKEALNFNLSYSVYLLAAVILCFTLIGIVVAIPIFIVLPVLHIIFTIIGGIKANEGVRYRYPATIAFFK